MGNKRGYKFIHLPHFVCLNRWKTTLIILERIHEITKKKLRLIILLENKELKYIIKYKIDSFKHSENKKSRNCICDEKWTDSELNNIVYYEINFNFNRIKSLHFRPKQFSAMKINFIQIQSEEKKQMNKSRIDENSQRKKRRKSK
jgi:hypothetical protein